MEFLNQTDELRALGISVIDQESLEENVEAAVDNAVIEHSRKQKLQILKREIRDSIFGLKKLSNKEKEYRFKLSGMKNRLTDPRQYLATEKLLSENTKLINDHLSRRKYLEDKLQAADVDISELDNFDLDLEEGELLEDDNEEDSGLSKPSESEKDKLIREGKMTPFGTYISSESSRLISNGNVERKFSDSSKVGTKCRQTNNSLSSCFDQVVRKVYQDSPSDKIISNKKKVGEETEIKILNSYLKDQVNRQKSYASDTKFTKRKPVDKANSSYGVPAKRRKKIKEFFGNFENCSNETRNKKSPLKMKILHPKKHWKESHLGSTISELESDQRKQPGKPLSETVAFDCSESDGFSESDYVPSEDELFSDHNYKEASDERVTESHKKIKLSKKDSSKSKRMKKTKDDGNLEDYKKRIKFWNLEKLKVKHERIVSGEYYDSDEEEENDYEEFSGGYRIPLTVWNKLYKYQKTGVRWLWELHCQGCGGILGDEMGLGKTIEVISFLVGVSYSKITTFGQNWRGLGPVLVVCPATVLHQWVKEFHKWWPPFRVAILHDSGAFTGKRPALIHNIHINNGILVTSYSGLTKQLKTLLQYNWHYIILDEGHKIRNPEAQITVAVKRFETPHRIILSGSPIQNSLKELWSLFDFVFPGKLGTLPVFMQQFSIPITQGGYANATKLEVQTAFRCATILRDTINPYLLRRMKNDVRSHLSLPDKNEQVLFCGLTEDQRSLYKEYISGNEVQHIMTGRMKVFVGLINLRKICNHPDLYSGGPKLFVGEEVSGLQPENTYGWWKRAGKMIVLHAVLKLWHKQGHRILLFTQSRQMMCILEKFIQDQNYSYLKMDGTTGVGSRQPMIEEYNNDPSIFVFLLTTRVGGLGVNLTGADRVIIFDPDWNPSTDTQARERAWRIGQTRHVTIYRLLTAGTIEEKIYHRQIFKQFLTNRVLKDPKQQRFFKSNDLFELFTLNEGGKEKPESVSIFAGIGSEIKVKSSKMKKTIKDTKSTVFQKGNFKSVMKLEAKKSVEVETEKFDKEETKKYYEVDSGKPAFKKSDILEPGLSDVVGFKKSDIALAELEKSKTAEIEKSEIVEFGKSDFVELIKSDDTDSGKKCKIEIGKDNVLESHNIYKIDSVKENKITNINIWINDEVDGLTVGTCTVRKEDKPSDKDENLEGNQEKCIKRNSEVPKQFSCDNFVENSVENNIDSQSQVDVDTCSDAIKREKMMQFAKLLSKKIEKNKLDKKVLKVGDKKKKSSCNKKGKKFEGERIEFLVKKRKMKCEDEEEKKAVTKSQDEYVLAKLFKKSGVHTALSHDVIVNSGDPDYLLLESEAERVAKEAMKKVRLSRRFLSSQNGSLKRNIKKPRFGVKNNSLVDQEIKAKYKQKGKKKLKIEARPMFNGGISEEESLDEEEKMKIEPNKSLQDSSISELNNEVVEKETHGIISSSQLLQRMRERNRGVDQMEDDEPQTGILRERLNAEEAYDPAYPSTAETECDHEADIDTDLGRHIDLLADIRNFVAFQATSSGCASTDDIVTRFKQRLPPNHTHIFKALLNEICDFRRNSSKQGMWYIKGEFR